MADQSSSTGAPNSVDPSAGQIESRGGKMTPDDVLPPVQAPSGGLIVQLFFIPLIIVGIIVLVWMGVSWIAHKGASAEKMVAEIEKMNAGSWQAAYNLSQTLADPQNDARRDESIAVRLADVLRRQREHVTEESLSDQEREQSEQLRYFLAQTLGQFEVTAGLPGLITTAQEDPSLKVREAAIEALARLTENAGRSKVLQNEAALETLLDASRELGDEKTLLRIRAAFALGVLGTEPALERLEIMLGDAHPDVRYNAAVGLARHGDARAIPILLEMLDPENEEGVTIEEGVKDQNVDLARRQKRALIVGNGLRAARLLAENNSTADLSQIEAAVEKLLDSDFIGNINQNAVDAKEVLRVLRERKG